MAQFIMKQQDEKLDVLLDGVNTLQGITKDMTSALDEDAELLKELDDDVQRTQGRLESVVKRVDTLLDSVAGILTVCRVSLDEMMAILMKGGAVASWFVVCGLW